MNPKIKHFTHYLGLSLLVIGTLTTISKQVYAQITPDNTLPVNSVVNSIDQLNQRIEGGTTRGGNLFHSFSEFNVSENGSVYFNNPIGIDNILTRVTGGNISNILGTLGVDGTANLFLINPHGIYFGKNASLDISGSFTATTADSITLGENGLFSATNPQDSNLLDIQPNALFTNALKNQQAIINNQGNLQVGDGSSITLFGANITSAGTLTAPGGTIELTATGNILITGNIDTSSIDNNAGDILITSKLGNIEVSNSHLNANVPSASSTNNDAGSIEIISELGNIKISNSYLNTSAGSIGNTSNIDNDAGSIEIISELGNIEISNSHLNTNTYTQDGWGGDINVEAGGTATDIPAISLTDSTIDAAAYGSNGKSGDIFIAATNDGGIKLLGENQHPQIFSDTFATDSQNENQRTGGDIYIFGGDININNYDIDNTVHKDTYGNGGYIYIFGKNITVENNSQIKTTVEPNAVGISGNIYLQADDSLRFQNSTIIANNEANGVAGTVELTGDKLVSLINTKINSNSHNSSGKFNYIKITSEAGSINLNNTNLDTNNSGTSFAGNIELNAGDTININNGSKLNSQGNYGYILIDSQKLNIDNSTFSTNNPSIDSDAGFMRFKITKLVEINNSKFSSQGNLGYIYIESPLLTINNSQIITNSSDTDSNAGYIELSSIGKTQISNSQLDSQGREGYISIASPSVVIDNSIFNTTNSSVKDGEDQFINSGNISINADNQISILNYSQLNAFTKRRGNAGNILLNAPKGAIVINNNSGLSSNVEKTGVGTGGYIDINTQKLQLLGNSAIKTLVQPGGEGNAGDIKLMNLNSLEINHSEISATSIDGQAGSINIKAKNSIEIRGEKGIAVEATGKGEAGNLNISTAKFIIADGAKISASNTDGAGGSININADTFLSTNGGQLITNTSGKAKAGNISLKVIKNITLADMNSGIFASTNPGSSGDSGSINIDPEVFIIKDGAGIGVSSQGSGKGGNIYVQADTLKLDNNAFITAATASNQGGEINLTIGDLLLLRHGSNITATAGKAGAGGNGGNVKIDVPFIVALPHENSNITANAFQGNGGNINIKTNTIFGLEFREQETELSDITASSKFGLNGEVTINRLDVDPSKGLVTLPNNLVDASNQLSQGCASSAGKLARQQNKFSITGKGGLPSNPSDLLTGTTPLVELADVVTTQNTSKQNSTPVVINHHPENTKNRVIQQAQGWVIANDGKVFLTSTVPKVTLQNAGVNHPHCQISTVGITH